jgi:pimeloyl-ACP methyl ester carboxylesterase
MKLEIITKYPVHNQHPTPLLFIHGAMHTASCWDAHFLDYFAQRGYVSHAVNLRGHGKSDGRERLRWTRIADFVEDIANTVRRLPSPPILIGHSMGAFIIQKYMEDHAAPGAVLLSSPSPAGLLPAALENARRHPLLFLKVNLTLSLFPLVSTPALAREAFFSADVPDEEMMAYWKQMQDDSYMAYLDMVALGLPKPARARGKTPLLILGAGRDNMLTSREIEATAMAYGTQAYIIPGVAHNSMLERNWQAVADRILAWLDEQDRVQGQGIKPSAEGAEAGRGLRAASPIMT